MLSKIKNVSSRREYESNSGNTQCDLENSKDRNDKKLLKKVFFDADQVEKFLTSEFFATEEFLGSGCWEKCSRPCSYLLKNKQNLNSNISYCRFENLSICRIAIGGLIVYLSYAHFTL